MEKNGIEIVISVRQLWNPTRQTLQGCCFLVFPLGWEMFWSMVHSPPPLHCFSQILSFVFYLLKRFFSFIPLCPIEVVQSLSCVQLFANPWTADCQASLSITISWSLLKLMSIESKMPFSHLILRHPLLLLPSIVPSIRVFSKESAACIRWPK